MSYWRERRDQHSNGLARLLLLLFFALTFIEIGLYLSSQTAFQASEQFIGVSDR